MTVGADRTPATSSVGAWRLSMDDETIRIGISSCLLGMNVRWNAGHKQDRYLTDTLGAFVAFVPVCPEVEAGFGVPRETFRLEGDPQAPRLMTTRSRQDCTERMQTWARARVEELAHEDLCGFIFKSDSPSSGMVRVKVYSAKGMPQKKGVGLFARESFCPFLQYSERPKSIRFGR